MCRILLDMDDVLAECSREWLAIINNRYGLQIEYDEIRWPMDSTSGMSSAGISSEEIYSVLDESGFFLNLPPVEGAIEGVNELLRSPGIEVLIATALPQGSKSPGKIVDEKLSWLAKHIPQLANNKDVIVTKRKDLLIGDILIDDAPPHLNTFRGMTIIFDRPWNRTVKRNPTRSARVVGWNKMKNTCLWLLSDKSG